MQSVPGLAPRAMTLDEVLDLAALQKLAWTYCHAVDRRDFRLLRSLYHEDAIDDHGAAFRGTPDEYIAWLSMVLAQWEATSHAISNSLFLIDGTQAQGELLTSAYHRARDGNKEMIAHGRYLDHYEKRDGVWRFLRRTLVLDWIEERSVIETAAQDMGIALGRASAQDPCYERLPLFRAQRR